MSSHPRQDLPSLAIITTNHNTWDRIVHLANQFNLHDRGNFSKLLIYDDCSDSQHHVDLFGPCMLYRGSPNVGLTKSLNRAIGMVSEEIVIIFDSDAYPLTPLCQEISEMFKKDELLGAVAIRTIGRYSTPTESFSSEPNAWTLLLGQALYATCESYLSDRSGRISVYTCAMAVRKSTFVELGGFDEAFDWLDLDQDFSMRLNRSRWKIAICPNARAFHEGGGTTQKTRHRVLRHYKNRWYLLKKFNRIPFPKFIKSIIIVRLYLESAVLLIFGHKLFSDAAELQDKTLCRKELIQLCKSTF